MFSRLVLLHSTCRPARMLQMPSWPSNGLIHYAPSPDDVREANILSNCEIAQFQFNLILMDARRDRSSHILLSPSTTVNISKHPSIKRILSRKEVFNMSTTFVCSFLKSLLPTCSCCRVKIISVFNVPWKSAKEFCRTRKTGYTKAIQSFAIIRSRYNLSLCCSSYG